MSHDIKHAKGPKHPDTPKHLNKRRAVLRRAVLKGLGLTLPAVWVTPVVTSVLLPAHAQSSPTPTPTTYAIGEPGPCDGIVFFISNGGLNGLEAAPVDQGQAIWGCNGFTTGATDTAIGAGATNTAAIIAASCNDPMTDAANLAAAYMGGGCSGWHLPSIGELNEMHTQLHQNGLGGFSAVNYLSSTEFNTTLVRVLVFTIPVGALFSTAKAPAQFRVRAVRAF